MTDAELDRAYDLMAGILSDVRGQVQFAEAKNGALFATTMAVIVGSSAVLASEQGALTPITMWIGSMSLALAGAAFAALTSFLPVSGRRRHRFSAGSGGGENLLYWEEICKFTPSDYVDEVLRSLGIAGPPGRLLVDLSDQIVINSGIADRKFRRFGYAAKITVFAIAVPTLGFFGYLLLNGFRVA